MQEDHDYWKKYVTPLIGDWLNDDTSVQDVCAFAEKVYFKHDLSAFQGDSNFVQNNMAQASLSKLRSAIAGVYLWRLSLPSNSEPDRQRLIKAADFALRQAIALCPNSPEAISLFVSYLHNQQRTQDADLIAKLKK